jgi:hypothetical protein
MVLGMRPVRCGVAALAALSMASAAEAQTDPSTSTLWPKWGPFLDLGGKIGTKRNLGDATLFVPVWQDERSMLFGDVRVRADNQSSVEGNFGLGFRRMVADGWNMGLYGFYDHRRSPNANLFDQFTAGAELLGLNFDARVNTYWPFGNTVQTVGGPVTPPSTAIVSGTSVMVNTPATMQAYEYALRGFDAEAGVRIPITPAESPYNLRFYAGGFRFDEPSGVVPIVAGPRLRLEFTDYDVPGLWNGTRFTVGGEWQSDQVRGSQFFAGLRFRVPLQAEPRRSQFTIQERRMTDTIVRDVDIVANTQSLQIAPAVTETASQLANGTTFSVINSNTTTGNNLATAVTNAGNNSTVILSGTFQVSTFNGITTAFNQTLMAGNISVRTASGHVATLSSPATIAGTNVTTNGALMTVQAGGTLQGLTLSNAFSGGTGGSTVIIGDTATGVNILNNSITATQSGASVGIALAFLSHNAGTVSGNTLTATGSGTATTMTSLLFNQASSSATVSGNTFDATGGTSNNWILQAGSVFNAGSTGNVRRGGACTGVPASGSISFTDGTSC